MQSYSGSAMLHSMTNPRKRLWKGLETADLGLIQAALAEGASPTSTQGGAAPLGKALRRGQLDAARLLVAAGADVNGVDRGWSVLERACGLWEAASLVDELLARGATPTHEALRWAVGAKNTPVIDALLAAGAPPWASAQAREQTPALVCWLRSGGVGRGRLVVATLATTPSTAGARQALTQAIIQRKDLHLLRDLALAEWFPVNALACLNSLIHAQWKEGVDWLLASGRCPAQGGTEEDSSALVVASRRICQEKNKPAARSFVQALLAHGFSPLQRHISYANQTPDNPRGAMEEPAGLASIQYSSPQGRLKLVKAIFHDPSSMSGRYGINGAHCEGGGLAHLLVDMKDFKTLDWVLNQTPMERWESDGLPGLLTVLLKGGITQDTHTHLMVLLDRGANTQALSARGNSCVRVLVEQLRPHPLHSNNSLPKQTLVEELAQLLIARGADANWRGPDGKNAFDSMHELADEQAAGRMQQWQLRVNTPYKSPGRQARL